MLRHLSARMDATSFRQHASYLGPHSASSFSRIATPFQGLRKNIPPMDEDALANLRAGESHLISPRQGQRKEMVEQACAWCCGGEPGGEVLIRGNMRQANSQHRNCFFTGVSQLPRRTSWTQLLTGTIAEAGLGPNSGLLRQASDQTSRRHATMGMLRPLFT